MLRSYYGQQRSIDAATEGEERCAQRAEQCEARRRARLQQELLAERQVRPLSCAILLVARHLVCQLEGAEALQKLKKPWQSCGCGVRGQEDGSRAQAM